MKKVLLVLGIVVAAVAVGIGGFFLYKKQHAKPATVSVQAPAAQAQEENKPEVAKRPGEYVAYDPAKFAQASDGKVILFFNAKWSKTCKMMDGIFKDTAKLPNNFTILAVDYDKNALLKKQYQVPFENTYVQVDAQGNMVNRWSGSESLEEVVALAK